MLGKHAPLVKLSPQPFPPFPTVLEIDSQGFYTELHPYVFAVVVFDMVLLNCSGWASTCNPSASACHRARITCMWLAGPLCCIQRHKLAKVPRLACNLRPFGFSLPGSWDYRMYHQIQCHATMNEIQVNINGISISIHH